MNPIEKLLKQLMEQADGMEIEKGLKREVAQLEEDDDELWDRAEELRELKENYEKKAHEVYEELAEEMQAEMDKRMEPYLAEGNKKNDEFWDLICEKKGLDRSKVYEFSGKDGKIYQKIQSKIYH